MTFVQPKKSLGQHFLKDQNIAQQIVNSIDASQKVNVLEIGSGMGVLTKYLLQKPDFNLKLVEIDRESVEYLLNNLPIEPTNLLSRDFLKINIAELFNNEPFVVIGNFPYNISSQIFFKILENRNLVPQTVCMIQKEVAERISAPPGSRTYGILSVLLQAFFDIEYLFTVHENVFIPPPKVKSAVIRLKRNTVEKLNCDEVLFKTVVKTAFNQRRKTLRNSVRSLMSPEVLTDEIFNQRPEQLGVEDFVKLTNMAINPTAAR
jgi:16S rRNA (adenine1518-N6/adenine1519-N6)-dimethyltransferase